MRRFETKKGVLALYMVLLVLLIFFLAFWQTCTTRKLPPVITGHSGNDTIDAAIVYGPLSYYLYADTLGGINYDMLRIYERESSLPVKFWPVVDMESAFEGLSSGKYDLLASAAADYEVRNHFLASESVFLDRLVLVQLSDASGKVRINSAVELGGDSIYVGAGSPAVSRIENLSREIGEEIIPVRLADTSDEYLCIKVAKGEIPLAVVNEKAAREMQKTYPALSYDNPVSFTQFQSWIFAPADSALYNKVNNWIVTFKETPEYRKIIEQY